MGERKALGKGLAALLGNTPATPPPATSTDAPAAPVPAREPASQPDPTAAMVQRIAVDRIAPNPDQPREHMDPDALDDLAASIARDGVIQPVVVRPDGSAFLLIAGERRWRAAQQAGLTEIPAVVHHISDPADSLRLALVENIQRRDLNPLEEARAYRELIQRCGLTQEQLGEQVARSRSTVTNLLRLLNLPAPIQTALASGEITMGHARALLAADTERVQLTLAKRIVEDGLSVRQVEQLVSRERAHHQKAPKSATARKDPYYAALEGRLREALGTKVALQPRNKTTGSITITYYSVDELEGLLGRLGVRLP